MTQCFASVTGRTAIVTGSGRNITCKAALHGLAKALAREFGRDHKGLIDVEMIYDGWYVIVASGVIGALYAKRRRILWFLISIVLAMLMLLLMLLGLGALKTLMFP